MPQQRHRVIQRQQPPPKGVHSQRDFEQFDPLLPGKVGERASLYDSLVYPAAGANKLIFFSESQGSGTDYTGTGKKNFSDTNMELDGVVGRGQQFLVQSIELIFYPGVPLVTGWRPSEKDSTHAPQLVNDEFAVRTSGSVRFFVGQADVFHEAPLMRFPAKTNFSVEGALSDSTTAGANQLSWLAYPGCKGRPWILHPYDKLIPDGVKFGVELWWEEGMVALPSGNPARIFCVLDGVMQRAPQ